MFIDTQMLDSGNFERVILRNIERRAHFLVILTPSAVKGCTNPEDWVRREVEHAILTRRNIIPLMFDNFDFKNPAIMQYLTGDLAKLRQFQQDLLATELFSTAVVTFPEDPPEGEIGEAAMTVYEEVVESFRFTEDVDDGAIEGITRYRGPE